MKKLMGAIQLTLSNCWKHFKTICIHKWFVFKYCRIAGITWRGIIHDLSKFSPVEFFESVKYYQGTSSPINACKADKGYSLAWQHHKGRNSHHYEYWIDKIDQGGVPIKMPYNDVKELICDYLAAARTYEGKAFEMRNEYFWWRDKIEKNPPKMHPKTLMFIDEFFHELCIGCPLKPYLFDIVASKTQYLVD